MTQTQAVLRVAGWVLLVLLVLAAEDALGIRHTDPVVADVAFITATMALYRTYRS